MIIFKHWPFMASSTKYGGKLWREKRQLFGVTMIQWVPNIFLAHFQNLCAFMYEAPKYIFLRSRGKTKTNSFLTRAAGKQVMNTAVVSSNLPSTSKMQRFHQIHVIYLMQLTDVLLIWICEKGLWYGRDRAGGLWSLDPGQHNKQWAYSWGILQYHLISNDRN